MGDVVFIQGLEVDAVIGAYDWERQLRQRLVLDLELAADVRKAAASDAVADAVDYAAIAERVTEFVQASDTQLIETLAERVAELITAEFGVPWLRLELRKPRPLSGRLVAGVRIERGERPADPPPSSDHALHLERLRTLAQAADLGPQDPPHTDPTTAAPR
ncbi:MAG TPA: dihydroneopterin aldolase [Actinomycetota bacterium]